MIGYTYTKIQDELFDSLTMEEAVVYTKIKDLCSKKGFCNYTDQQLCDLFFKQHSRRQIMKIRQSLVEKGLISKTKMGKRGGGSTHLITVVSHESQKSVLSCENQKIMSFENKPENDLNEAITEIDESQKNDFRNPKNDYTKVKILTNESQKSVLSYIIYKNKIINKNKLKIKNKKNIEKNTKKIEEEKVLLEKIEKLVERKIGKIQDPEAKNRILSCFSFLDENGKNLETAIKKFKENGVKSPSEIIFVCDYYLENCETKEGDLFGFYIDKDALKKFRTSNALQNARRDLTVEQELVSVDF